MSLRVILITGANGGLGQAMARAFLQESPANVVWLGVRSNRERADKLAQENSDRCFCVNLDVTSVESWQSAAKEILSRHQRLDVLVNNAGSHEDALLATMPPDSWRRVLATNLDGVFHGCQAVLPTMISQRGGAVIDFSSLNARPGARRPDQLRGGQGRCGCPDPVTGKRGGSDRNYRQCGLPGLCGHGGTCGPGRS